jgi:multiple sugar transport system ATP-binding protein
MAKLVLEKIYKSFEPDKYILEDISFDVDDNEFLVLVGPSGCGKTTILRLISGLETPSSGNIYLDGQLLNNVRPGKRSVGMVFQNYALYPHLSVFNNLAFPLQIGKENKETIKQRVEEVAKILHIDHLLTKKPKELSGGERQRVALGRAIIRIPSVFLFDEPLSNLDAKLRVEMRTEIVNLVRNINVPAIYVTHDQVEALTMGTKIVVLKDGKIQQIGSSDEIYRKPANTFVATFIGSPQMNIFRCVLNNNEFKEQGGLFSIKANNFNGLFDGQKVLLGIRPEDILISNETEFDFKLSVESVEYIGHETIIYFRRGTDLYSILSKEANLKFSYGELLHLKLQPNCLHIFNEKGERINTSN